MTATTPLPVAANSGTASGDDTLATVREGRAADEVILVELRIPDLELHAEIGRGGMGVVFSGRQTYLDRLVAVKVLALGDTAGQSDFQQRFHREATLLAGLHHPHIVACHQAGVTPCGRSFLVMEYIHGPSLRRYLDEHGPLDEGLALVIVAKLAKALGHALASDIIHRDVKPENVLLQRIDDAPDPRFPYEVKLVDLGLAQPQRPSVFEPLAEAGALMGTPAIMAPEQFRDAQSADFRSDIYSLGCLMYHALTGRPAFAGATVTELVCRKVTGEVPDPGTIAKSLSPGTVQLVRAMLAPDPAARPGSYQEIVRRCEVLAARRAQRVRLRIARVALLLIAVVSFCVLGGWYWQRTGGPRPAPAEPAQAATHGTAGGVATNAEARSAPAAEPALAQAAFGPPVTLADIREWTESGPSSWSRSGTRDSALSGADGEISHPLPDGAWEVHGVLALANAPAAMTDSAIVSVLGADGARSAIVVRNLGSTFLVMVQSSDPAGNVTTHHTEEFAPGEIDVLVSRLAPHFLQVAINGLPLEHLLDIPASSLPLRGIALRVSGSTQVGHGRLEVGDVTMRTMAFPAAH